MTRLTRLLVLLAAIAGPALHLATAAARTEALTVVPAPVPPDGYYAGTPTHLVFVLIPNSDPSVKGISLYKGDTLAIILPKEFKRNDGVAVRGDADVNLTLTKGWPQAPVRQSGQYKIFFDEKTNAFGVRADTDIGVDGANSPGAKMIHLRGDTFVNPAAGSYQVEIRLADGNGKIKNTWSGVINIASGPIAGRVAPTNFHLGPNENSDFQEIGRNQDAPKMLGVLLWDSAGKPKNGVAIAPTDRARFPKYDYLLVEVKDGDKVFDATSGNVIGGIILSTPPGAVGQKVSTPFGADGKPVLSGEVPRSAKFSEAQGGGKPNNGLLPIIFHSGDKPGQYQLKVEMLGGNSIQYAFNVL
jgi:hypothetical protein